MYTQTTTYRYICRQTDRQTDILITVSHSLALAASHQLLPLLGKMSTGGALGGEDGELDTLNDVDLHHLITCLTS